MARSKAKRVVKLRIRKRKLKVPLHIKDVNPKDKKQVDAFFKEEIKRMKANRCPACGGVIRHRRYIRGAKMSPKEKILDRTITVWKDGTWKCWENLDATYATDDSNWLVNIPVRAHYKARRLSEKEMIKIIRKEWNLMPLTIYIDARFSSGIKKLSIRDIIHAIFIAQEEKDK